MTTLPRHRRTAGAAALVLLAGGLALAGQPTVRAEPAAPAPALLTPVRVAPDLASAPASTARAVTLHEDALPQDGGSVTLPVAGGRTTVRLDAVERDGGVTTWQGTVGGQEASSFSLVRVGETYRGQLTTPAGVRTLTRAAGDTYWWTLAPPQPAWPEGGDVEVAPAVAGADAPAGVSAQQGKKGKKGKKKRRGKAKVTVLVGYTKAVKAELGGKAAVKAAAALAVAQTNAALRSSGAKAKLKLRGVVKAKGTEAGDSYKDLKRLSKPRDGRFDNLHRARKRRKADLVHLLVSGDPTQVCGRGYLPRTPREAHRTFGFSMAFAGCLPYLVSSHEIGHNLGADHNAYPGVSHDSRLRHAYGFVNPAANYLTVMSYYDPCVALGNYACVRVPYFSTPKRTMDGQPLAADRRYDNARAITKIAPRVARYYR